MRLEAEARQLPKHRRCLLGAPEAGAPGSSHRPPVPVPRPCPDHQAPRAPPAEPPCTHLCTRLEPALPGPQERHHLPAQAVASGEPPGEVVSTPSATVSWAPLASTGARCRVGGLSRCQARVASCWILMWEGGAVSMGGGVAKRAIFSSPKINGDGKFWREEVI